MPRFLIAVIILALASWAGWAWLFFTTPPETPRRIVFFLVILLIALTTTLSVIIFLIARRLASPFTDERLLFRKWLRRSLLVALLITGAGALKILGSLSWLNIGLAAIFIILLEIYLTKKY